MTTAVFLLGCAGATQILTRGRIFKAFRPKYYFFHCSMCTGVWVGAACSYYGGIAKGAFEVLLYGCAVSAVSYALTSLIDDDGLRVNKE